MCKRWRIQKKLEEYRAQKIRRYNKKKCFTQEEANLTKLNVNRWFCLSIQTSVVLILMYIDMTAIYHLALHTDGLKQLTQGRDCVNLCTHKFTVLPYQL